MTRFALEINDAGLLLARSGGEIVSEQPGIALLDPVGVLTGEVAMRKNRLQPLGVQNDFWRTLGTEPLPRATGNMRLSAADLAYTQLSHILEPFREEASGLLLTVPPGYSREQLGLLLGIAHETRVPLLGLADSALTAAALQPVPKRVLHMDLQLHQAALSVLETDGSGLKRGRFEILPRQGWFALQQAWVQWIATVFVRRTRFDPLHQAATEQLLVDRLPGWLATLTTEETLIAEIEFGQAVHAVELNRNELLTAAQPHYTELVRLIQAVRPARALVELQLTHRFEALPGLEERLSELRDLSVRRLPRGAAALGALAHEVDITRPADSMALVYRLPTVPQVAGAVHESLEVTTPKERQPTHILFRDRAWAITETPLTLGWSVSSGRTLPLPQTVPGLSRSHCTVRRHNGSVVLEDHSTYGSYVNEERVNGYVVLTTGDSLRLGAPGVTLKLIQLMNDNGAPEY